MKKMYKWVHVLFFTSLLIIILHFISSDWVEWFPGAGRIFDLVESFFEAFIASSVIFYLVNYFPSKFKAQRLKESHKILMFRIKDDLSALLTVLFTKFGTSFSPHCQSRNFLTGLHLFESSRASLLKFSFGSSFLLIEAKTVLSFKLSVESIKRTIEKLIPEYDLLDEELTFILSAIYHSDFFEIIERLPNDDEFVSRISNHRDSINLIANFYESFFTFLKKNNWPVEYADFN